MDTFGLCDNCKNYYKCCENPATSMGAVVSGIISECRRFIPYEKEDEDYTPDPSDWDDRF